MPSKQTFLCGNKNFMMTIKVCGCPIMASILDMKKPNLTIMCGVLCCLCLVACTKKNVHTETATPIVLYAAISVSDVMNELIEQYQAIHDVGIRTSYAGSSTLAKQIKEGAKVDIFVSADNDWVDYLQKHHKVHRTMPLLSNRLVLVSPKHAPRTIDMTADNLHEQFDGKLCTGDTKSVPVGKYAKEALMAQHWWQGMQGRLVETADVRTALNFVARGECALGVVYATDVQASENVVMVGSFDDKVHTSIIYPIAQISTNPSAQAFYDYLNSDTAKVIYQKHGFGVVQ